MSRQLNLYPSLYILAGGRSRRMGVPKVSLRLNDEPLLGCWLRQIKWPAPVKAVLPHPSVTIADEERSAVAAWGLDTIHDAEPDAGPLAGVAAALADGEAGWRLVVPLDMPNLSRPLLDWVTGLPIAWPAARGFLLRRSPAALADGDARRANDPLAGIEPFPLLIHSDLLPAAQARLQAKRYALHRLAESEQVAVVEVERVWPPELWLNINTPDGWADYNRLRQRATAEPER